MANSCPHLTKEAEVSLDGMESEVDETVMGVNQKPKKNKPLHQKGIQLKIVVCI